MDLQGPDFSDSRDLMIIFSDSKDPNQVPKNTLKNLHTSEIKIFSICLQLCYH